MVRELEPAPLPAIPGPLTMLAARSAGAAL
jgi:hypothetical protein